MGRPGINPVFANQIKLPSKSWMYDFIRKNTSIKKITPTYLSHARIRASLKSNIKPWLLKILELIKKRNYERDLIIQMDETSCLVHKHAKRSRVVAATTPFLPILAKPPILSMTCLFSVNAKGGHLQSQMIIPRKYEIPPHCISRYPDLRIRQTEHGWMERKVFQDIHLEVVEPEIN
jgi:hypothetical protein